MVGTLQFLVLQFVLVHSLQPQFHKVCATHNQSTLHTFADGWLGVEAMQFLTDLKKAAKGEREEEFSFDDDAEKGKADKWLEKINKYSKKIQSAPAAAREKLQKMREPKDEEKAAYFEEAAQEKAKSANWWSGCDPKEDPDVKQWSRSASSETLQSHAAGESVTSGDESWVEEEDESEDEKEAEQKGQVRMSQIDFESLQNGGPAVSIQPMETIAEAADPEPPEPKAKAEAPAKAAAAPAKVPAKEEAAKDPFDSSGDEAAPAAAPPVKAEEAKKGPKKGPATFPIAMPFIRDIQMDPMFSAVASAANSSDGESASLGPPDGPFHQTLDQDDHWRCADCWQDEFCWTNNAWMCTVCGSNHFEAMPAVGGRWVFVPNSDPGQEPNLPRAAASRLDRAMDASPSPMSFPRSFPNDHHLHHSPQDLWHDSGFPGPVDNPSSGSERAWHPTLQRHARPPSSPSSSSAPSEFAESETRTDDPVVDPDQPIGAPRRRRRRNGSRLADGPVPIPEDIPLNLPGTPIAQGTPPRTPSQPVEGTPKRDNTPAKSLSSSSSRSWNSLKGPVPGVRFRGGQPPAAPTWHYDKGDLRAFRKWMKRVELWHHQVRNYVPKNEAGILLFNSLKGELEEELEDADISNIYSENGVKFITDAVKKAVETRSVHVKRKLLADYEHIYRNQQEGMRSYINRYQRTERALNTVDINVEKMYDKEARGARLLERSKLSHEHQRQVLIGSMQSLDFDTIKDVLMFQWPDHRAPPPPPAGQQQRPTSRPGTSPGGGKGKGNGKPGQRRQVMATENVKEDNHEQVENEDDANDEDPPEQDQCDDGETDDQPQQNEEDANDDIFDMNDPEIAEIFTITAKKLAGVMQARKYGTPSNVPKRSIADRKKTTTCSACGIQGHWAGDPECQVSAKGHSKGKGDKDTSRKPTKTVHFMNYHGGPDDDDDMPPQHEAHQIFVTRSIVGCNNQVRLADAKKASGFLILDTACQRLCAGKGWSDAHSAELKTWSVVPIIRDTNEVFEFGKGQPLQATHRLLFPAALGEVCVVLAPCILDAHIPCLASRTWLTDVGAVIDLGKHVVHFTKFNTTVNLQIVNGHVGINIADFTNIPQALQLWNVFRDECLTEGNQHMHKEYINLTPLACQRTQADASSAESFISQFAVPHGDRPSLASDMADQLARPGGQSYDVGKTGPKVSQDTYDLDYHDGINRSTSGKGPQDNMPAPLHQAKRKSPRKLRTVPGMQSPVEVRQGERGMGATHKILWFLTAATAFLHNCVGQLMDKPSGIDQEGTFKAFEELRVSSFDFESSPQEPSQVQGQGSNAEHRGEPMESPRVDHIGRPGVRTGRAGQADRHPVRIRLGRARQLSGQLERSSQVLEAELQAYDKLPAAINMPKIDIMELYAGHADISFLAYQYDLKALEPFDLIYGHDMTKDKYKRSWRQAQKQFSPLLVVVETECTLWNIFNENLNYAGKDRLAELEALREDQLPLVREGVQSCLRQIADGNFFLYENPEKSRIWDLPEVQELASRDDVYVIKCHAGAYGACNSNGDPILKTYQWITNSEEIAAAVSKKMTPAEQEQCVPLIGKEVRLSARYPIKLCRAILKALRIEARRRWPQRFVKTVEVLYQEPVQDPAAWSKVLSDIHKVFNATSTKTLTLADYDPIHQQVADLVPWELTKVQIVRTPIQRRLPREFFFTHRGAILEYQDGQIVVEAEALDGLHFPKQRFSKAVAYACFWYGYGEPRPDTTSSQPQSQPQSLDAQQPPSSSNQPTQKPSTTTSTISTITFPGCPAEVPQEVKSAITRLHLNLGHPSEKELFRLLAWQGAVSKHMITAVKHMVCASCSRSKPPLQPRPSAMPTANIGQFNDALQSDVFYCRDVLGTNHAILGIVDQSTLLHQAARLPDLSSETTLKLFRDLWFKPYGFPQTIRVDPGGNFALNFRNYVERHGIFLEVIPAEAHWRIGLVERRNSVLRDILERIIDAESIFDVNDFDQALDGAIHAINSMTYTHGRPPYMAVFGQIPRIASGLLQDDMSLITHPVQQGRIRPDILRAEAMRALADINTSQALRRALLRKTATTNQKDLLPGQSCAYWRWQIPKGRGTKKKGAWIVARFLSYDPDGRSAWLHSGTTTIQVSLEQLRGAFGFEHWQPTREDQQALKDAAASIRRDIWQDHRSTAPPPDEDQYDYALEHEIDMCALPALRQEGHAVLLTDLTGQQSESDAESSDPDSQTMDPLKRLQSRKEAKALEREVPWRSILRLPPDQINDYVKSNQKEEKGWQKWGSIEPVPGDEARKILADPQKKRRVLRSRACYRNKSRDPTKLVAKTRVVALGHLDPDLYKVARDSPTPSRTSEYLLLSIFIAGINQLMQNSLVKWILWAGDVSTAFLQGSFDENERTEPLYLLPPRDQITLMAKTFMSQLYKVKSNIYGLANAPRTWFLEVVRRMKSINYLQHSLDHLLFYKIEAGELVSVCIVYVDDFLLTCRETYDKSELLDLFTWGSQKQLSLEQPLEFKGKELTLKKTKDDKFHLHVTQTKFIKNTEKGKVQKGRIAQGPPLTTAEETEFRSVTGSLQWLASQTRPDIAAWVSLSSRGKETGPAELAQLYETLEFCKLTPEHGLVFQDVAINRASILVGYADSSCANAAQCASQQGSLVLITTPHCTEVVTKGNLIDWKSNRSARVCRSTLAAEAIACDDCVDRTFYANAMLSELLSGVKAHKDPTGWRLRQLQVTDCKSLYDAIAAENPRTTEKRTYVDIRSIQEYINHKTIHWAGKKPVKLVPSWRSKAAPAPSAPAKDPFADSDSDTAGAANGYPAKGAKAPAPAAAKTADPFADSDEDTGESVVLFADWVVSAPCCLRHRWRPICDVPAKYLKGRARRPKARAVLESMPPRRSENPKAAQMEARWKMVLPVVAAKNRSGGPRRRHRPRWPRQQLRRTVMVKTRSFEPRGGVSSVTIEVLIFQASNAGPELPNCPERPERSTIFHSIKHQRRRARWPVMESQALTLLPLPTKEPQVLCVSGAGELNLHQFPHPETQEDEIVVADEGNSFVLLLRATCFVFFDLKAQCEVCGNLTLRNLRPGDVAEVLCKVKTALASQRSGRNQPLAVRKKLPLGGVEFVQLVENLLVHVCVFADGSTAPRVAVQRWNGPQASRGASSFSLCTKVLPNTWDVAGGPLLASIDVELQALSMAVAHSGVVRLSLQTLVEHDSQFTAQAGPLEALLTPSFGDVLDVFAGPVTMPRSPSPMRARVPPIFVASAGGIHCVLTHQVLSLALPGLSAMAPGPGKTCWHGLSCLAIAATGIHSVHLLQKDELVESKDALPEEQLNYQLVSTPIQLDASPFAELRCRRLLAAGTDKYLGCFSQLAVLMELRHGKLHVRAQLQVESLPRQPSVVQACCCTAWPGLEWQQLCVALAGTSVPDSGEQVEISRLQLWQLASSQQGQSWKIAVAGGCVFESHSWPLDSEILAADDHGGDLVAVTSRSRDNTVLLMIRTGQKVFDEVQQLEGHSLLLRRFHGHALMQVTEKELRIFRAGDGRSFQLSQMETLQPFCSHAAACGGDQAPVVCFFAAGPVLLRKEVTLGSNAPSPQSAVGLSQQISSLSACAQSPSFPPLVFASLWISHDVLVLDGTTLTELQRFPATARIHSMHAFAEIAGWILAAGSVDGQLMIWKTQGDTSEPRRHRLSRGPLQVIRGDASMACRGSCEAFLLRRPSLEPEPLLVEKETHAIGFYSDGSLLTLSNMDGGNELTLACGKLEDAQGQHSVLQSRRLRGEVLALAFKAKPKPCLLALAQHRWLRRLSLMALDDQLQLLFTVPMEESPPWPLGQPSAWLWDLGQDVLVALGHPGNGSPATSLHKLQLPVVRPDWRWLMPDGDAASHPHSGEGKVVASLRLDSPVLVAAQALEEAPVVLGSDELRFLSPETLRASGRYGLRQRLSALSLTAGRPKEWSPMAVSAAGQQMFAFLGFYDGPPQIVQLKLTQGIAPSCSVLRLVDGLGVISNIQRSPIYHVAPFEVDCPGEPPCGFMVWEESSGLSSIFELDFSSPLEAPSARRRSQASQRLNNSHWTLGQFWPKIAGGCDPILNHTVLPIGRDPHACFSICA
eukprot:s906_g3.t2